MKRQLLGRVIEDIDSRIRFDFVLAIFCVCGSGEGNRIDLEVETFDGGMCAVQSQRSKPGDPLPFILFIGTPVEVLAPGSDPAIKVQTPLGKIAVVLDRLEGDLHFHDESPTVYPAPGKPDTIPAVVTVACIVQHACISLDAGGAYRKLVGRLFVSERIQHQRNDISAGLIVNRADVFNPRSYLPADNDTIERFVCRKEFRNGGFGGFFSKVRLQLKEAVRRIGLIPDRIDDAVYNGSKPDRLKGEHLFGTAGECVRGGNHNTRECYT